MASDGSTVDDSFSYDAYGVMLGGNPTSAPTTSLLYAGEQFDVDAQMYYLRARYYDQNTGRFNRMDPWAGSPQDPQSLHKYLYCHANPVNAVDPTGEWSIPQVVTALSITTLLFSSFTTGFVAGTIAADMAEDIIPDGVIFNIGLQIGLKGGVGGVTVSLVYDVKLRQSYLMLTGEVGIAPTTYLRGQTGKINPTITAGFIFNMNNVSQLHGISVTATWPAVLWRYRLRISQYKNPFYQICVNLAQLMNRANIVRHNRAVVEFTQSLNGPAIVAGGVAPYSFQWNIGYTGGPWSLEEISQRLPAFAQRTIQNVKGYLNSLSDSSSASDFESQLGNALTSVPDPHDF